MLFLSCRAVVLAALANLVSAVAPSDSYRDADVGQSGYLGGNHNMDPAVVDSAQFGQLWKVPFNAKEQFYAKPLVFTPSSTGTQLVFLASTQNWIRTVNAKTGAIINQRQVHPPFLQSDIGCTDIPNTIGIVGTPIIDPNTDIAYFFSKTYIPDYRVAGSTGTFNGVYYFHAVDVTTLQERPGYPILVDGTVADNDARKVFLGGVVLQRPSLLQVGNMVYGAFGGHCDLFNYTGTVIGVDVTKTAITAMFVTEAGPQGQWSADWLNGQGGGAGIWQGGLGLASDGQRLFFVTGNGGGHENQGNPATGQSGLKTLGEAAVNLNIGDGGKLSVGDYFQPYDYQNMDGGDQDFGSGGIALLDPTVFKGTGVNRMAVTAGKNGKIYILNADNLGGYKQGSGGTDLVLQTIVTNHAVFGGSGSYPLDGGFIYSTPVGYPTSAYRLVFDSNGRPSFTFAGQSKETSAGRVGTGIPTVTSNKGKPGTGIVWITDPDAGIRAWYAVPGADGFLKTIKLPQINGVTKFQRPAFGDTRLYVVDNTGALYCLGSPVNLPLNCTSLDFGNVALGSSKQGFINCTAIIGINSFSGMTVGDSRFEVDNTTLPASAPAGSKFSIPVRWNLTTAVVQNSQFASFGSVTPGIKSTALTIYTNNAVAGYATVFPLSLTGNQVSEVPYLDLTPNTVDFGGLTLGVSGEVPSSSLSFVIANKGLQPLQILGYAYTSDHLDETVVNWTNATQNSDLTWDLGPGFVASNSLPQIGAFLDPGTEVSVAATFSAVNGPAEYLSYFGVWSNGQGSNNGQLQIILEGAASTSPIANYSVSTSEGGWVDTLDLDMGFVAPGANSTRQIRICNNGGSALKVTKSKPPLGVIRAVSPSFDLHEDQAIPPGQCAYGNLIFNPVAGVPPNMPDYTSTNEWTLNTNDLNFGVHVVRISGVVRDRIVGPSTSTGNARFQYMGCYKEGAPKMFPKQAYPSSASNENGMCIQACINLGYGFAATTYHSECWCGNTAPPGSTYHTEAEQICRYTCTGDAFQTCGGFSAYMSVYYDTLKFTPTDQTFNTTNNVTTGTTGPFTVGTSGGYSYIGCYNDGAGAARSLTGATTTTTNMTVDFCSSYCSNFKYFGVENGRICYCGNTITSTSKNQTAGGCTTVCVGNAAQYCGATNLLNMYQKNSTISAAASSAGSAPTSASTSSSSVSTSATSTSLSSSSIGSSSSSSTTNSAAAASTTGSSSSSGASTGVDSSSVLSTTDFSSAVSSLATSTAPSTSSSLVSSVSSSISSSFVVSSTSSSSTAVASTSSVASSTSTTPTASPTPPVCPGSNSTSYFVPPNSTYIIECGIDHSGNNLPSMPVYPGSFAKCIIACANTTGCVTVSYSGSACYMKSKVGPSVTRAGLSGARLNVTTT